MASARGVSRAGEGGGRDGFVVGCRLLIGWRSRPSRTALRARALQAGHSIYPSCVPSS